MLCLDMFANISIVVKVKFGLLCLIVVKVQPALLSLVLSKTQILPLLMVLHNNWIFLWLTINKNKQSISRALSNLQFIDDTFDTNDIACMTIESAFENTNILFSTYFPIIYNTIGQVYWTYSDFFCNICKYIDSNGITCVTTVNAIGRFKYSPRLRH